MVFFSVYFYLTDAIGMAFFFSYFEDGRARTVGSISDTPRVQALATDDWFGGTYAGSEASRCPPPATKKKTPSIRMGSFRTILQGGIQKISFLKDDLWGGFER